MKSYVARKEKARAVQFTGDNLDEVWRLASEPSHMFSAATASDIHYSPFGSGLLLIEYPLRPTLALKKGDWLVDPVDAPQYGLSNKDFKRRFGSER